jgi:c-di-GMP-binding flagellar brake protein YcgR
LWLIERNPNDPCGPFLNRREGNETKRMKPQKGVFAVERRRYPRYSIEFPLTYSVVKGKPARHHWGLVRDAAEGGILVYLKERVKIGAILKIEMFYAEKLPLKKITATAKIVWSDLAAKDCFGEYRYGLQLESIQKGDLNKLRILLRKCTNMAEIASGTSGPPH